MRHRGQAGSRRSRARGGAARLVALVLLAFAACMLVPPAAQADPSPVEFVAVHVTLRGPGTIVDNLGGGIVCTAPAGTVATVVTTCDGTAEAVAQAASPPNFFSFVVVLEAHGPTVGAATDDAGWTPSSWAGTCVGATEPCNRADTCSGTGAIRTCQSTATGNSVPLRVEPVMSDSRAPTASIASGPGPAAPGTGAPYLTPDGRATFAFQTDEPQEAPTYQCSIDSAAFAACASPFTTAVLSNALHTLDVRATDSSGLLGPTVHEQWDNEVDPRITFTSAPGAVLNANSFTFAWQAARVDTTGYVCRFDSSDPADFAACTSPYPRSALTEGAHHLDVRARIHAANGSDVLGSTATWTFTASTATGVAFTTSPKSLRVSKSGHFTYAFSATPSRSGKITLQSTQKVKIGRKKRLMKLASVAFTADAAAKAKAKYKLSSADLKALKSAKSLRFAVTATLDGKTYSTVLTLKAPRKS